jgi:two-component system response regulator YesN
LQEWVKTVVAFLKENTLSQIQTSREHLLMKIHSFIDTHLSAGITLQSIADHVHLHPVYISKIFKLMTGETISDYLLSVRMEKAAHLLNYTDLKIYEICAQLGYYAPAHFIKLFKKHFQATPQEYRNQLRERDKPVTRSPS